MQALDQLQWAEQNALLWFAEVRQRELYRELGYSSIQQYASEALGFSQNKTYQFIRLAGSLKQLPQLHRSVARGEICWTKAREVAKVATPRTQGKWIKEAKNSSNRQLEQKVVAARKSARSMRFADPDQHSLDMAPAGGDCVSPRPAADQTGEVVNIERRQNEVPTLEIPVTITLRFSPEQLARYEALLERIEKVARTGNARKTNGDRAVTGIRRLSREELHLASLEDHLAALEVARCHQDADLLADHNATGVKTELAPATNQDLDLAENQSLPRGKSIPPYQIIIYKCDTCGQGTIRTRHGTRELSPAALQTAACDARIQTSKQNRATIPPSVRRKVLSRDRHRCRMRGCGQTRFLEVHHLLPRAAGGKNGQDNLVTLCASCHRMIHEKFLKGKLSLDGLIRVKREV
jgi:hypothetical protein